MIGKILYSFITYVQSRVYGWKNNKWIMTSNKGKHIRDKKKWKSLSQTPCICALICNEATIY